MKYHVQVREPTGKKWLTVNARSKTEARQIATKNAPHRTILKVTR